MSVLGPELLLGNTAMGEIQEFKSKYTNPIQAFGCVTSADISLARAICMAKLNSGRKHMLLTMRSEQVIG